MGTDCEVGPDDRPICRCKNTYIGNPLQGCRHECDTDNECGQSQKCDRITYRCESACGQGVCGENANCQAINHRAQCSYPPDFLGDAYSRCYTECTRHSDCASNKACVRLRCQDPCFEPNPNVCGQGATCEATNHKAVCSCPRGYTGDPSSVAGGLRKRTFARPIPVDLEPTASQALTGRASIVQFAPVLPAGGETLRSDAREVSASTTASVLS